MNAKIFVLLGVLIMGAGIFWGYSTYNYINSSVKTEARVSRVIKKHRSITPVFEFTIKGKTYEFEGANTSSDEYKLNDKEIIYYNPSDPNDNRTGTFMGLWFMPVFLSGFGFVLFVAGLATMLFSNKKSPAFTIQRPGNN